MSRIHLWSADGEGQGFWRMELPGAALRRRGHDVNVSNALPPSWHDADAIVGPRVCQPEPTDLWQHLASQGRRLVYDVDDDYLTLDGTNPALWYYSEPARRDRLIANIRAASVVTCVSERLADTYRTHNPNTVVVPNGLPEHILTWERPPNTTVMIGWSGTSSTLPELDLVGGRLRRILERNPGVGVRTVGVQARDLVGAGLRHTAVELVPWVRPGEAYLRACQGFDIWVAPYRSTEFNRCKAATKAIEAAFLGIPIVASAIEPYARFVQHGVTGFLVERDHEWDTYLRALINDPDLRARMGAAAREQARQHTIETIAPLWERAMGIAAEVAA